MSQASVASNINPVRVLTPTGPDIEPQFSDSSSSFMDVLDTFRKWNTSSLIIQKFAANGYEPDPEFQIDDTIWRELTHNVPSDLWDSYSDAVSLPHAYHLAEINRIVAEKRQILANSSGPSSFLAPVVGSFLDPGAVAMGIITGGGSTVLRMGMGARAITLGGLNAAASGALTGLESTIDPAVTGADIARSVAGGAGFGAAAGAFGTSSRAVRAVTGAAGQALPPLAIDLFDERPGNAKAIEFASNLLFGGVFNALPGADATPEQFRAAETLNRVGKNMIAAAEGRTVEPTPVPELVKTQFAETQPPTVEAPATPPAPEVANPPTTTSNVNLGAGTADQATPQLPGLVKNTPTEVYHGTSASFDVADPERSGGLVHFTDDRHSAANYASGGGGGRESAGRSGFYVVDSLGTAYEMVSDTEWKPVGRLEDDGITVTKDSNVSGPSLTTKEINRDIRSGAGMFQTISKSARIVSRDISGKRVLDLKSKEGLAVLAGLNPENNSRAREIIKDAKKGKFYWNHTKLAYHTKAFEPIIRQLNNAGYDGIYFGDDGHNTYAMFRDPAAYETQTALDSSKSAVASTSNVNLGMGAAGMQIPDIRIPKDQRSLDLSERIPTLIGQDAPRAAFSKKIRVGAFDFGLFRWDMVGMTGGSDVPEIRLVGSLAGDDPTLPVDGSPRQIGAAHWVSSRVGETEARALLVENEAFAARLDSEKASGIPYMQRTSKTQFEAEITRALRQGIPEGTDPHVAKAATEYRKLFDEIVELAKDHNINLNYASNYVNRIHLGDARELKAKEIGRMIDPNATPGLQRSLGMNVITDFFAKAIESEYVKRGENVADPKIIADIRGKAQSIIDKAGISNLTDDTTGASIGSGKNRTYERIELDETYSQTITLGNGQSVTLSVEDFIENNIGVLFSMYTRQMHGYMAISRLSEILGAKINPEDANSKEGVNAILRMVEERAKERGLTQNAYAADLKRLRVLLAGVAQIPVFETTAATRAMDVGRNVNVVQYMANFGTALANLTTIADTAAQQGHVNTMKSLFPSVMDVVNQLRGGKGSRRQALELYHMGIGMERQLRRVMPRVGEDAGSPVGRSKVELGTAKAAKLAMDASLQTFAQDLAALVQGRAFMYNLDDIARSGNMPSERRLALWTLDRPTVQRIVEQVKLHALADDGQPAYVNGQRRKGVDIEYMNLEAWDAEIRQRYKDALYAEYRRIIQPGERSQMPYFFTTPIGRIIGQFRSFAFQAHVNRFLAELQVRDSIAVKKLIYGSVAAAALYAGRMYLDAQMREDPRAYLEEKLSPENLWKSAFARASYSALFPTIWDSLYSDILGNDPTFSFARTTDLQGGIMFGSPTVQRLKELGAPMIGDGDVMRLPRAAFNMATGDGTQKDWRVIKAGIPIPDFLNFRKFLDEYVRNNLPTTTMSN